MVIHDINKGGRELGMLLRTARNASGMTQEELAETSGVAKTTISLIEQGKTSPTISTLIRLAEALGQEVHLSLVPRP